MNRAENPTIPPTTMPEKNFRFSIDRGGTFTDVYAEVPGKPGFRVVKLLSEDPANYPDAPREGIRRILAEFGIPTIDGLVDESRIDWIRMGTTVATNALLERKGARTGLVTGPGFGDLFRIGGQDRPRLFDLKIDKPALLYESVLEIDARIRPARPDDTGPLVTGRNGETFRVLAEPEPQRIRTGLAAMRARGITSLAVVLPHAYGWSGHEEMVGEIARELGFSQVSLSSQVMPLVKMVSRGDTTLVDAYLTPHIQSYLESFRQGFAHGLKETRVLFMQSDGGLTPASAFRGCRAILSGPAGGVIGYGRSFYRPENPRPLIGFDMGGTSTDVSRYNGEPELTFETLTAGVRIQSPQLDIRTVAAGGGSRLFFRNGMLQVGPQSSGAHPGPICYRKNGHLSITDANLVLGRLRPEHFPAIFGPEENQPLDLDGARQAMAAMCEKINRANRAAGRPLLSLEETALGFIRVANQAMIRPIREISVMRGYDIKEHILATFGGAGGQHACAIARELGLKQILIHRFSGILSACGLALADLVVDRQEPAAAPLTAACPPALQERLDLLQNRCEDELIGQGVARSRLRSRRFLSIRVKGSDTALMIEEPEDGDFARAFIRRHRREFGFLPDQRPLLIDAIRVRTRGSQARTERPRLDTERSRPVSRDEVQVYFEQGWRNTPLFLLSDLAPGHRIRGPALVIQDTATIVVEPGCDAAVTDHGDVAINVGQETGASALSTRSDPVQLAIFSHLFMSIAEQMGRMLQKTAVSTNIKERLDFSCALFDEQGRLVANAPHVPVHLGSMSEAVQAQIRQRSDIRPGDVLVSNHPVSGGSHLPDITVITPVFHEEEIIFWVASRGHHADIGGISPGSMPPFSRQLKEEGAAIVSLLLVRNGVFREEEISRRLTRPDPEGRISGSRRLADNLADLRAQVAANQKGIDLILEMIRRYSLPVVRAYMTHVQEAAEEAVRESLRRLARRRNMTAGRPVRSRDRLDDGSPIVLSLTIDPESGEALFDFTGTGTELWGNLNAPPAVTRSALLYCLRLLVDEDIPLNHGCLRPVRLIIPAGSLLAPSPEAAVVGGNVLTSQRLVDVILRGFGVAAASQGCMNNLTFGNRKFGYYETIGGGAGAGPGWHGQSGVHTHMTNTRITDIEILERRYPVLVREFSLRQDSGGRGCFRGGDGLVRDLEFLEEMEVAILSERRVFPPWGLDGGEEGRPGRNLLVKQDGRTLNLGGKNQVRVAPGDRIRILTPGGGGYGLPKTGNSSLRPGHDN